MNDSIFNKAVAASKWSALAEISSKVISPLIFVILARLLTPNDYGVVAVAAIVISFSQVFWDVGLGKALIQREDQVEESANVVFWTNLVLGILIYVILYFSAEGIASLFKSTESIPVLRVQGIQIVLASLCSVQTALYQRDLNFRTLFWVRLITSALPGLASIPIAIMGYGYWALVGGTLLGSLAQLLVLWKASSWRPRLSYDRDLARQLLGFGLWVMAEGLLAWFYVWVDSMIVGAYLGPNDLGLYRTGNSFVQMVFGLILSPLMPVLFSMFSRIQHDIDLLRKGLLVVSKLITMIALPSGIGLLLVADPLADVLLGAKWIGVAQVIGILGLTNGISWLVGANAEVYRAMGRPDLNTKIMFSTLAVYTLAYIWAAPQGLTVFLWTRLGVIFIAIPVHLFVVKKYLRISPFNFMIDSRWIFIGCAFMAGAVWVIGISTEYMLDIVKLTICIISGILIFSLFLLPEKEFVKRIVTFATRGV
ncbi:MAG: lipopolysaccharide biosynthesis protein [Clostridiaceae bacterium]|nr:lipopolysaccharide biosynthesis protein [Clostridiaceae bacterium]